jgi:hypothetical protein
MTAWLICSSLPGSLVVIGEDPRAVAGGRALRHAAAWVHEHPPTLGIAADESVSGRWKPGEREVNSPGANSQHMRNEGHAVTMPLLTPPCAAAVSVQTERGLE